MTTPDATLVGRRPVSSHRRGSRLWLVVLVIVMLILAAAGIAMRMSSHAKLAGETTAEAVPSVSIVKPTAGPATDELSLPATMQAFIDAPIYARTDGYLKAWYVDIGGKVTKGQLMAVIETPEVDQQLAQAEAAVANARASLGLAEVTNKRYQVLVKTDAVSRQEADQAASQMAVQKAAVDGAVANVNRLKATQSFQKIYAPFNGVVTARNTDVGQLITSGIGAAAGSGGASTGRELFRVAALDRLRTFIPVPQNQASFVKPGMPADLHFLEYQGKIFPGRVARTSNAIDATSRTLLTEVDVDNPDGVLFPGAYVDVHLHVPGAEKAAVRVPSNTLIFRSHGLQLAVVGDDNKVHLAGATVGRDFGNSVEIVNGVTADDRVVLNPPDSLLDGQDVRIAPPPSAGTDATQDGHQPAKSDGGKSEAGKSGDGDKDKGDKKPDPSKRDVQPSRGSGGAVEKASRAPDPKAGGKSDGKDSQGGGLPSSGATAPGTDGNQMK